MTVSFEQGSTRTAETGGAPLSTAELGRLQRAALLVTLSCIAATLVFNALASASNFLLAGLSAWFSWCSLVGAIHYLLLRYATAGLHPAQFGRQRQWAVLFLGLVLAVALVPASLREPPGGIVRPALQLGAVAALAAGCMLYFLLHYARAVQARLQTGVLDGLLNLTRIAFPAALASAALLFVKASIARDYTAWMGWILIGLTGVLVAETLVRFAARFFQPAALRDATTPAGSSLLLDAVFGRGIGWRTAVASFETLIGAKLSELWFARFVRQLAVPLVLATAALAWLSTCLSVVPAGSRGVGIVLGQYQRDSLAPGLHLTWPAPFERVEIIPTERVRSVSLGFDKDTDRAVLWTERHVEGEQNLLVGNGETLLTINVPILYRISDPVAFLETTADPDRALASIAERKLTQLTSPRDSYAIMTDERADIAGHLKTALQDEVDRLGLGLDVLFVGLKDIHPPVDVAPAFEDVISAEEQKEATVDKARAESASTLPRAEADAARLRAGADAAYEERIAQATGEAARFDLVSAAARANSPLYRTRVRLDTLEQALAKPDKIILGAPGSYDRRFYLDLRDSGASP